MTSKPFGAKECTAEILMTASKRVGRSIKRNCGLWDSMNMADAIADVCINNPEGACDAFRVLHEASGAENLTVWSNGQSNYQLAAFMRAAAQKVAAP